MLLIEDELHEKEGMNDEVEVKKFEGRHRKKPLSKSFINKALQRATQRTQRFIRWLGSFLCEEVHWNRARVRFGEIGGYD